MFISLSWDYILNGDIHAECSAMKLGEDLKKV